MPNPPAAMLVIGDEILSGRTRDANMYHLAGKLTEHGVDLKEVRVVSDDETAIVNAVKALRGSYDHVFTSGGIGPTHDDITADCVATAFGMTLDIREDAHEILKAHYDRMGTELNAARLRMARIPEGAVLIENPISAAPGFSLENVHVMAGVPKIFEAMVEGLLPTITGGDPVLSETVRLERGEGEVAADLGKIAEKYPNISMGSYPFNLNGSYGTNIVFRGTDACEIERVVAEFKAAIHA